MSKRKIPVLSIVLYILSGLLFIYTIWASYNSHDYISKMVAQNQIVVKDSIYQIASFYMTSSVQYGLFAVILFTLGYIFQKGTSCSVLKLEEKNQIGQSEVILTEEKANENSEEFKESFEENEK